jgi:HPr kinase/phosphorylase
MSREVLARTVFQTLRNALQLSWIGGETGANRVIFKTGVSGKILAGRLNLIHPPKLQILGVEELDFLCALEQPTREALIELMLTGHVGAILLCGDSSRVESLREGADTKGIPLWHTTLSPAAALEKFREYKYVLGNEPSLIHGEFLEVFGLGVLITGDSGIGKSELALELISRGHRLIADDTPQLARVAPHVIEGTCPPSLRDFLEVRGLGILNIRRMFGDSAIKRNKRVRLIVHLSRVEDILLPAEHRLQGMRRHRQILEVSIPEITLPIGPGRNIAVLLECAVRDHIQRLNNYNADEDLTERLQKEMAVKLTCE